VIIAIKERGQKEKKTSILPKVCIKYEKMFGILSFGTLRL
jgi:hypothetical protein